MADAQAFRREWEAAGPMVPGLDPMEAMDRLRKYQQMFEVCVCVCVCVCVLGGEVGWARLVSGLE